MTDLIWSFVPWVLFLLTDRFVPFGVALGAAGAAAVVVLVRAFRRHHVHMLDIANIVYFAVLALLVVAMRPSDLDTWSRYAQGGAHGFLTVLVLGSIVVGHPFTEAYARDQVPESAWHTTAFRELNRRLSMAWGAAFVVGTASLLAAGAVDGRQALLRVVIPF
ncbi:MAG TPA: hypothetical protein VGI86_08930, partial [Acidimicrobiia bacterium]